MGLRCDPEEELLGADYSEHNILTPEVEAILATLPPRSESRSSSRMSGISISYGKILFSILPECCSVVRQRFTKYKSTVTPSTDGQ